MTIKHQTEGAAPAGTAASSNSATESRQSLADTAREEISQLGEQVGGKVADATEQVKAEAGKVAEKAKSFAGEQKDFVAGQVEDVARAVDKVAGELEASDSSAAGYARTISDTASRVTETLKNKDVDELLSMAEQFGRRQPVAFIGAAALLGFAASRFLVASAGRSGTSPAPRPSPAPSAGYTPATPSRAPSGSADQFGGPV